jgi:hypothetical protein
VAARPRPRACQGCAICCGPDGPRAPRSHPHPFSPSSTRPAPPAPLLCAMQRRRPVGPGGAAGAGLGLARGGGGGVPELPAAALHWAAAHRSPSVRQPPTSLVYISISSTVRMGSSVSNCSTCGGAKREAGGWGSEGGRRRGGSGPGAPAGAGPLRCKKNK